MKLFFAYLRQRRRVLGLLALFAAIFFSIFALYHLPMKAVAYPALLCIGVGGIVLVWDFLRLRSKHRKLSRMTALSDVLSLGLPEPWGIEEQDYQRIIDRLTTSRRNCASSGADATGIWWNITPYGPTRSRHPLHPCG